MGVHVLLHQLSVMGTEGHCVFRHLLFDEVLPLSASNVALIIEWEDSLLGIVEVEMRLSSIRMPLQAA